MNILKARSISVVAIAILSSCVSLAFPGETISGKEPEIKKAGRIEGRVIEFPNVERLDEVRVQSIELYVSNSGRSFARAKLDAEGNFVFEEVPSGAARLQPIFQVGPDESTVALPGALLLPVLVRPGETTQITLFGKGRGVVGKVVLPAGVNPENVRVGLELVAPPFRAVSGRDGRTNHDAGWSIFSVLTAMKLEARLDAEGMFRIDGVREGNYRLTARLVDEGQSLVFNGVVERGYPDVEHGKLTVPFMAGGESREPHNLGSLKFVLRSRSQ